MPYPALQQAGHRCGPVLGNIHPHLRCTRDSNRFNASPVGAKTTTSTGRFDIHPENASFCSSCSSATLRRSPQQISDLFQRAERVHCASLTRAEASTSSTIVVHDAGIDGMLPSTTQLLKEEVVDVVANLVFDVAVVLPADLAVVLNDLAHLERDIGGKFRVSDAGLIEVAPRETPECLRMAVIPKSRWRGMLLSWRCCTLSRSSRILVR